jgi:hypothetical protein
MLTPSHIHPVLNLPLQIRIRQNPDFPGSPAHITPPMVEYMHQIELVEPRRILEETFVSQARKGMNFSHFIFLVKLPHSEKLSGPWVRTFKSSVVEVDERPRQVVVCRSEKDAKTLFRRPVVIHIDNNEAHGAVCGEASYERRQGLLNLAEDELGILGSARIDAPRSMSGNDPSLKTSG